MSLILLYSPFSLSGTDTKATSTNLRNPCSIWLDGFDNLYLAEMSSNRIRKCNRNAQIVSTVAGAASGVAGNTGDGGQATAALLYNPTGDNELQCDVLLHPCGKDGL